MVAEAQVFVYTARVVRKPPWWNGIHEGLKIPWPQGLVGSTPTGGTREIRFAQRNDTTDRGRDEKGRGRIAGGNSPQSPGRRGAEQNEETDSDRRYQKDYRADSMSVLNTTSFAFSNKLIRNESSAVDVCSGIANSACLVIVVSSCRDDSNHRCPAILHSTLT